jgi:hypothetical protein
MCVFKVSQTMRLPLNHTVQTISPWINKNALIINQSYSSNFALYMIMIVISIMIAEGNKFIIVLLLCV